MNPIRLAPARKALAAVGRRTRGAQRALGRGVALAVLAFGSVGAAQAWPQMDPTLDAAVGEFAAAQTGDDALKARNAATFDRLLAGDQRSRDALALVFGGAATARMANTTWMPWKKLRYAEDGLARIDKALSLLTPKDEQPAGPGQSSVAKTVKLVAAGVFVELPGFFNRDGQARKLMQYLTAQMDTDPTTTPAFKASLHTLLGQIAARDENDKAKARQHFERAIALNVLPESEDARRELQALGK